MKMKNKELEKKFQQAQCEWILAHYEQPYIKSHKKNPLYAWQALRACFQFQVPVPNWVQEYFIEASGKLLKIPIEREPDNIKGMPKWIQDALSLNPGSGGKIFKDYRMHWRNLNIFYKVKDRILNNIDSKSVDDIYYEVGEEFDLGDSQVKKIYFKVKDELNAGKINPKQDKENKKKTKEHLTKKYGMVFKD